MFLLEFGPQQGDEPEYDDNGSNGSKDRNREPQTPLNIILREFSKGEIPPYAILSHRWGPSSEEISFQDVMRTQDDDNLQHGSAILRRKKKAFDKIESCCRQALRHGLTHAWVDTCCIDKRSSAELSEALNSMFDWYARAKVCYVFMEDVESKAGMEDPSAENSSFRASRWFTRGWTLQEMIAPPDVRFYARDWIEIGRKRDMTGLLRQITRVAEDVLVHPRAVKNVCASQKMYWASGRETTRVEDRAYSLLGLFGISMPILYGEGSRAFTRLQEEIVRSSFDHTIFAWELEGRLASGLLADSPSDFAHSGTVRAMSQREYDDTLGQSKLDYSVTNLGINIKLQYRRVKSHMCLYIAFLACCYGTRKTPIFIYLRRHSHNASDQYFRTRKLSRSIGDGVSISYRDQEFFRSQGKIWVGLPEENLIQRLRPLIRDDLAVPLISKDLKYPQAYCLRIFHQGDSLMVCPAADDMGLSDFTIETMEGRVSVARIGLRSDCIVWLLLAIVDGELVSHVELEKSLPLEQQESSYDGTESIRSCKAFYDRCAALHETPCTEKIWRRSQIINKEASLGITKKPNDIIELRQESFVNGHERRRTFAVWLRLELNLDFGDTVMEKPQPWKKSLADLLRVCQPLFLENIDVKGQGNDFATDGLGSLSSFDSAPVLAERIDDKYLESTAYDKHDTLFMAAHAHVRGSEYSQGYKQGVSTGRKQGKEHGEKYSGSLKHETYRFPGHRRVDDYYKESGLLVDLYRAHSRAAKLPDGKTLPAEDSPDDCPCFNSGFTHGYDWGREWAVLPLLIGRYEESHIAAFANGYADVYGHSYFFAAVNLLADWGFGDTERKCRCATPFARGHAVGFVLGNASGRAERFGGEED